MTIDISDLVLEIIHRLDLDPDNVRQLTIHLNGVQAVTYQRNNDGQKYIGDDDEVATTTTNLAVRTAANRRFFSGMPPR